MSSQIQGPASGRVVEPAPLSRPDAADLKFSEANGQWQPLPKWAVFLIKYGFLCGAVPNVRRIGIVSMPCDSAGASLVALGAIRYRLSLVGADDSGSHFQRLQQIASQSARTTFLRHETYNGRFQIIGKDRSGGLLVERAPSTVSQKRLSRTVIFPWNATAWQIEGEPPVMPLVGDNRPCRPFFERLVEGCETIAASNLSNSDSAISLAGRAAGETATRKVTAGIRFERDAQVIDLSQLMTVHGWSSSAVSRVTFFNTRTNEFDRYPAPPSLVVADGDLALHKVLATKEFANSDVVGWE